MEIFLIQYFHTVKIEESNIGDVGNDFCIHFFISLVNILHFSLYLEQMKFYFVNFLLVNYFLKTKTLCSEDQINRYLKQMLNTEFLPLMSSKLIRLI